MGSAGIEEIVNFWFGELSPKDWFRKDEWVTVLPSRRWFPPKEPKKPRVVPPSGASSCAHNRTLSGQQKWKLGDAKLPPGG
jgi:hypothetical protein